MRINDIVNSFLAPVYLATLPPQYVRTAGGTGTRNGQSRSALTGAGLASRRGSVSQPTVRGATQDSYTQGTDQSGQTALLDQYIRKRAGVSFSIPQPWGGTANFTFEIETAYRLITPIEPGVLVDSQG
jgi:hypothetical protein